MSAEALCSAGKVASFKRRRAASARARAAVLRAGSDGFIPSHPPNTTRERKNDYALGRENEPEVRNAPGSGNTIILGNSSVRHDERTGIALKALTILALDPIIKRNGLWIMRNVEPRHDLSEPHAASPRPAENNSSTFHAGVWILPDFSHL